MCCGDTLFLYICCFVCFLCVCFLSLEKLSSIILLKILSMLLIWDYSPLPIPIIQRFGLLLISRSICMYFPFVFIFFNILCLCSIIPLLYLQDLIFNLLPNPFNLNNFSLSFLIELLSFSNPSWLKLELFNVSLYLIQFSNPGFPLFYPALFLWT